MLRMLRIPFPLFADAAVVRNFFLHHMVKILTDTFTETFEQLTVENHPELTADRAYRQAIIPIDM